MERWSGRVALVTGASSGIGAATGKRLARAGMTVVGCARSLDKLKEVEKEVNEISPTGRFHPYDCDLTKTDEIRAMFDWIKETYGGVDLCVNNASMTYDKTLLEAEPGNWRYMLDLSIVGLCTCTSLSVGQMMSRGVDDGQIINIGSLLCHKILGGRFVGMRFQAGIKHMTAALTEGFRQELREKNSRIRVTLVSPSGVNTPFVSSGYQDQSKVDAYYKNSAPKRIDSDEVADLIATVIEQKAHIEVHEVFFRPTEQIE